MSVQHMYSHEGSVLMVMLHAELAPECATAYHHYGTAVFYKAQEEQDVFGAPLQLAADEQDKDEERPEKASMRGVYHAQPSIDRCFR